MHKTLLEQLKDQAEYGIFNPGETIIRQGSRADAFYILLRGLVEIVRITGSGVSHEVSTMSAPAFFGEKGLLEEGRRTATVRAAGSLPVELMVVPRKVFMEFVDASEMMADEVAALIQKYRISDSLITALGQLTSERVEEIAALADIQTFSQGDLIICQGDPAENFFVLTKGRVEVLHEREDGRTYLINFHEPGEYFGEIGLLQDRPRSATVRAVDEGVEVLAFERSIFENLLNDSVEIETAITREIAHRLSHQAKVQDD
jgi:CRP-like cAMP-binding protein